MPLCKRILFFVTVPGEADLVIHHLKALLAAGVAPSDIAVIAPYNLQVLAFIYITLSAGRSFKSTAVCISIRQFKLSVS